jgi:hypothetical protein
MDKDRMLIGAQFLAFTEERDDIVGEYESKYGVTQTERATDSRKAYWKQFRLPFLFGSSSPESTGLFDEKELQKDRLAFIPDLFDRYWFYSEIQASIEDYIGKQ